MTYLDRAGEGRDRAVRRSRAARTTLIATAALASVGLAGAIGAGAANAQNSGQQAAQGTTGTGTPGTAGTGGTDDGVAHPRTGARAARLQGHLKNFGTQHALTTGSSGPSHAKSSGS